MAAVAKGGGQTDVFSDRRRNSSSISIGMESIVLSGLEDPSHTKRADAIETLRTSVSENGGQVLIGNLKRLFQLLKARLTDSNWSIAHQCTLLLVEMLPELGPDLDTYLPLVLPTIVRNLGDSKVVIRKASLQALLQFRRYSKTPESLFTIVIRTGLEDDDWRVRQESALALASLLSSSVQSDSKDVEFKRIIDGLVSRLRDVSDSVVLAAQQVLARLSTEISSYQNHIDRLSSSQRSLYEQHADQIAKMAEKVAGGITVVGSGRTSSMSNYSSSETAAQVQVQVAGSVGMPPSGGVEFGFVPCGLANQLKDYSNWKLRSVAIEELQSIVKQVVDKNPLLPHIHNLLIFLKHLVQDPNFKISLTTLHIVADIVNILGDSIEDHLDSIFPTLIMKLGDNKIVIRQADVKVIMSLMNELSPGPVLSELMKSLNHTNWHVREEILNLVMQAILQFSDHRFDFQALVTEIAGLLVDPKPKVKALAVEVFAGMFSIIGSRVYSYLGAANVGEAEMSILTERFQHPTPTVNNNGEIENLQTKRDVTTASSSAQDSGRVQTGQRFATPTSTKRKKNAIPFDISAPGSRSQPRQGRGKEGRPPLGSATDNGHLNHGEEQYGGGDVNAFNFFESEESSPFQQTSGGINSSSVIASQLGGGEAPNNHQPSEVAVRRRRNPLHIEITNNGATQTREIVDAPPSARSTNSMDVPPSSGVSNIDLEDLITPETDQQPTYMPRPVGASNQSGGSATQNDLDKPYNPSSNGSLGGNSIPRTPPESHVSPNGRGDFVGGRSLARTPPDGQRPYDTPQDNSKPDLARVTSDDKIRMWLPQESPRIRDQPLNLHVETPPPMNLNSFQETSADAFSPVTNSPRTRRIQHEMGMMSPRKRFTEDTPIGGGGGAIPFNPDEFNLNDDTPTGEKPVPMSMLMREESSGNLSQADGEVSKKVIADKLKVLKNRKVSTTRKYNGSSQSAREPLNRAQGNDDDDIPVSDKGDGRRVKSANPWGEDERDDNDDIPVNLPHSAGARKVSRATERRRLQLARSNHVHGDDGPPKPRTNAFFGDQSPAPTPHTGERKSLLDANARPVEQTATEDLLPPDDPEREMKSAISKFTTAANNPKTANWVEIFTALDSVRRLALFASGAMLPELHAFTLHVVTAMNNLRSSVAKNAIVTIRDMFQSLKSHMDSELATTVPVLLKKAGEANGFITEEVNHALTAMCENTTDMKALAALMNVSNHKSASVRLKTAHFVDVLAEIMGAKLLYTREYERLVPILVQFINEGLSETRTFGKKTVYHLYRLSGGSPEFDKTLRRLVSERNYNQLKDVIETGKKRGGYVVKTTSRRSSYNTKQSKDSSASQPNSQAPSRSQSKVGFVEDDLTVYPTQRPRETKTPASRKGTARSTNSSLVPKKVDAEFENLQSFFGMMSSNDFRQRLEGITSIVDICTRHPVDACSKVVPILDQLTLRFSDGNSKVCVFALQSLQKLIPIFGDSLESPLTTLVPALAVNLAASNANIRSITNQVMDSLVRNVDPCLFVQHFVNMVNHGNQRVKPAILAKLEVIVPAVHAAKPHYVIKYILPCTFRLLEESKGEIRTHNNKLIEALYKLMGHSLLDHSANLSKTQHTKLKDLIGSLSKVK